MAPQINTAVISFNCAREYVDPESFAENLAKTVHWDNCPELIFLSLQEVAPIAYAFLGGSFLQPYLVRLSHALNIAARSWRRSEEEHYVQVEARNIGMTAFILLVRNDCLERITWLDIAGTGLGYYDTGHKGCVGVRIGYRVEGQSMPLTFLAAHLAPGEENLQRRNYDWNHIVEDVAFSRKTTKGLGNSDSTAPASGAEAEAEPLLSDDQELDPGVYGSGSFVFFAGDLNYRTSNAKPSAEDVMSYPRPKSLEDIQSFKYLLESDQLTQELRAGRVLKGFTEAVIKFPPTYKYSKSAQEAAKRSRTGVYDDAIDSVWSSRRWPSWCDRILLLDDTATSAEESGIQRFRHQYAALPLLPTSDHQPISLYCELEVGQSRSTAINQREGSFSIKPGWKQRRAAARRAEIAYGVVAYLAWTWEGNGLILASLIGAWGGWTLIRSVLAS